MAVNIKLKRSAVSGSIPTVSSLELGELALNTYDGKAFMKRKVGTTETIVELASTSGSILSASYADSAGFASTAANASFATVAGSATSASYANNAGNAATATSASFSTTSSYALTASYVLGAASASYAATASYADTFTVGGTLFAQTIHVQVITSSTELITGSLNVGGGITGSFSGSLNNLQGTATHIPYFSSSQVLADSAMYQVGNASIAINQDGVTTAAPEALYVWQPNTDSFNVISGKGNSDNYLQLNIQNTNQGVSASSDVVATANNGDENNNYINMGINGENFNGPIGEGNDAYLYSTGNNLHIGNTKAGKHVGFFVGGDDAETNKKLQLNPNNQHQMSGSLDASGSITATSFITRGATSTQFVKGDGSLDSTSYTPSSVFNSTTSSLQAFSASILNFTSSTLVNSASFDTRINYLSSSFESNSASFNTYSASINAFSASILSYTASNNEAIAKLYAETSSLLANTASMNLFSASILSYTASAIIDSGSVSTRLVSLEQFSSSLDATFATDAQLNALSASFTAHTASINAFSASILSYTASNNAVIADLLIETASLQAFSASILSFTASQQNSNGTFATTGSNVFRGNQTITGSLSVSGSTNLYGTTNITGSVNVSGSTGTLLTANVDTIVFTGSFNQSGSVSLNSSVDITGSLIVNGRNYINDSASFDTRINNVSSSFEASTTSLNAFSASILNYTASTNATIADILVETASLQAATASLNAFSASILSYTASNNAAIADILIETASLQAATASLNAFSSSILNYTASTNATLSDILIETASLQAFSASMLSFTSSTLINSASFDTRINYLSSSFESSTSSLNSFTASFNAFSSSILNTTASINEFSASMLSFTASQKDANGTFATTGSNTFIGNQVISGSTSMTGSLSLTGSQNIIGNLTVTNTITAEKLVVQFITSSVAYVTGSTKFGDEITDTHQFTGSVSISGSLSVNGKDYITESGSFDKRINYISSSFEAATASLNLFSASILSYTASNNATIAKLYSETASLNAFSASILAFTASSLIDSASFDTRINYVSNSFEASTVSLNAFSSSILNYTASNNLFVADILTETASLQAATASLNLFSASILSYTASNNTAIAKLYSETASLNAFSASVLAFTASTLVNSASFDTRINYISSSFEAATVSLNAFSASILNYTASNNAAIADILVETASLQASTASLNLFSASMLSFTASQKDANSTFATTGSNIFRGNQTVTGSLFTSGSNTLVGSTTLTGSFSVSGSTVQTGNNTLIGNTTLSGSIIISGSSTPGNLTASVQIYGDIRQAGYHRFDPVTTNIDTSVSASYIYVSGSTNDLYFSQNGKGYSNVTRLRWLESNLYTGLLNGGLITATVGSTTYQISSGSGIIVNLNASLTDNPYPTIQYLNWGNLTGSISAFTSSYQQVFVGIDSSNNIFAQGTPFSNGQFDTVINIGGVFFQNGSTINAVKTQPSVAYGAVQAQNIFNRAFGPLKLSGYTLASSGSSVGSLVVGSGTAYAPGSNYTVDPNEPSYTVDNGTNISKIFRYRQSGSSWVYDTNGGAGYAAIDPANYSNNGVLTAVPGTGTNREWSIQRVFWFPNSVVKAIVVYYGNATYATEAEAIANISFESFVEAPNTSANAVYLGAVVVRNNADFNDSTSYKIQPGGLFRQVGGSGGGGSVITQTLSGLSDVAISGQTSGQALVWDSTAAKWSNKSFISASISGNAATATTAATASSADNFTVRGTLTAQNIVVQTITSSVDFVTGSTRFGTTIDNTHQFTGSVSVSGSLAVTAGVVNSLTSSYAVNADLLDGLDSSTFVLTGSFGAQTASFNAFSASILSYTASAKIDSGSVSTRLVNLEAFSSSLDATFATDADLNSLSASFIAHTASMNAFSASILNYTASNNTTISQLYAETASILAHTASINAFSASINAYTSSNNDAITSLYNATASLNAFSASILNYTSSVNSNISAIYAETSSLQAFSASMLSFTASQKNLNGTFATTGSNVFEGVQTINSNLVVTGSITAQTLVVQTITSSVDFVTGSTRFGTLLANTHQFTGSVSVTGSLVVNDSNVILTNQTASMSVATASYWSGSINNVLSASYALTASHATNVPETASFANNATSASYALTASHATNVPETASFANNATSASYSLTASFALNVPQTASFALTASYWSGSINNALSSSYALTASHATNVPETASFANNATSASYALTASFALNVPQTASFALTASYWSGSIRNAVSAAFADLATSASFASTASYALFAVNGGGGGGGGSTTTFQQATQAVTWSINHFLNTQTPVVQVYDDNFNTIIPTSISNPGAFQTFIYFEVSQSGYAILTTGGGLSVTGSNAVLNQTAAATTWSFNHNLQSLYPVFTIFDENDDVIIPQRIHAATTASAEIYFSTPRTGKAVASLAGFQSFISSSLSSSYATNADNAINAQSASYVGNYLLTSSFNTFSGSFVTYSGSVNNRVVALENFSSSLDATFATDADVNAVSASLNAYTASTNAFSASILAYTASNNATITKLYAETASILAYTASNNITISALYAQTASINAFSASILSFTSSYNTGSFTGSFVGTASFAGNATSASFASTASYWSGSIDNVLSASFANTASYADNFTVAGTLTAQTLVIQTITSSVIYSSGSNIFGNDLSNTQQLTGSVTVTGSLAVNGSNVVLTNQTASMSVTTASFASTASFTPNAIVNAVLDTPLNDTIEFTLGNGTTSLVTINNVGTASLATTASYWSGSINNALSASFASTASYWSGSIQNAVSAAFADLATSASFATTASYATYAANGGGGGISAIYIADEGILQGTASYFDFTGTGVSATVSSGTASISISGGGSGTQGLTTTFTQSSAAVSWSFTHNLNTRTPVVQVYDSGYNQITPQYISSSNTNEVVIGFGIATTGYAVISTGGALVVTGSNVILNQTASATTWSFNHGLNQQYPVFQVFNTDDEVIIPERIKAVDSASALIYFPTPVAGKAIASFAGLSGSIGGGSGAGFPFSGSAVITGSFLVSGSSVDFTQVSSFTGNLTGTSSYATFALTASTAPGYTVQFSQTASATTWSFTHNMGTRNPIVQVYDSTYKQIIPNDIVGIDGSTAEIRFDYAQSGFAIMSNGGGLYITGSTSTLIQTSAATTWSFNHRLNTKYPAFEVYDENDLVIIPAGIKAIDVDNAEIYFSGAQAGRAIANFSGINGLQDNAVSASFASSGSVFHVDKVVMDRSLMDFAQVNSSIVGSNNMFTQATGSYTSMFVNYTVASGSNARSGQIIAVWNAGTTEYNDVSTNDIGNTNAVTASVAIVSGEAQLNFQTNTSAWRIKSTATFM